MGKVISNEEVVKRFVDSKAVDFKAIGSLVAEMGPEIAASDSGHKMVLVGRPFIVACFLQAGEQFGRIEELGNAGLGEALGRGVSSGGSV